MAMLHVAKKRALKNDEAKALGLCTADSYADYGFDAVPFTGDDKPKLEERLRKALATTKLTHRRLLWGMSSAGTDVALIRFTDGKDGEVVLGTRYPLGD